MLWPAVAMQWLAVAMQWPADILQWPKSPTNQLVLNLQGDWLCIFNSAMSFSCNYLQSQCNDLQLPCNDWQLTAFTLPWPKSPTNQLALNLQGDWLHIFNFAMSFPCNDLQSQCNDLQSPCNDRQLTAVTLQWPKSPTNQLALNLQGDWLHIFNFAMSFPCNDLQSQCNDLQSQCNDLKSQCNPYQWLIFINFDRFWAILTDSDAFRCISMRFDCFKNLNSRILYA